MSDCVGVIIGLLFLICMILRLLRKAIKHLTAIWNMARQPQKNDISVILSGVERLTLMVV